VSGSIYLSPGLSQILAGPVAGRTPVHDSAEPVTFSLASQLFLAQSFYATPVGLKGAEAEAPLYKSKNRDSFCGLLCRRDTNDFTEQHQATFYQTAKHTLMTPSLWKVHQLLPLSSWVQVW